MTNLTFSDTPLYRLGDLEGNELYIKRDDLIPVSFGGNKARKAIRFFDEIDRGDYTQIVTYGSGSSNHCRIVSNLACARGLPCTVISPTETDVPTANRRMMELFGAEIVTVPVSEVHDTIEARLQHLRDRGERPYFIAGGGHGNLGTAAYVDCFDEIRRYEQTNAIRFDAIFFASGTGTTQAGLVCGKLLHGGESRIIGLSIARENPRGREIVLQSIRDYFSAGGHVVSEAEIEWNTEFLDRYTGGGYGCGSEEIRAEIRTFLRQYGIPLDPTYTGKACAGMRRFLIEQGIHGKRILFLHTGGTPLFFDVLNRL